MAKKKKDKTIESMLQEGRKFPPSKELSEKAHIKSMKQYEALYKRSIEDPEGFWAEQADDLDWIQRWDEVCRWDPPEVRWFEGGKLNVSHNCLDRHVRSVRKKSDGASPKKTDFEGLPSKLNW